VTTARIYADGAIKPDSPPGGDTLSHMRSYTSRYHSSEWERSFLLLLPSSSSLLCISCLLFSHDRRQKARLSRAPLALLRAVRHLPASKIQPLFALEKEEAEEEERRAKTYESASSSLTARNKVSAADSFDILPFDLLSFPPFSEMATNVL